MLVSDLLKKVVSDFKQSFVRSLLVFEFNSILISLGLATSPCFRILPAEFEKRSYFSDKSPNFLKYWLG